LARASAAERSAASRGEEAALAVETTDSAGAARRASMSVQSAAVVQPVEEKNRAFSWRK